MQTLATKSKGKDNRYNRRKHRTNVVSKVTSDLPRLIVNRSNKHMSAQIVGRDGAVIATASDLTGSLKGTKSEIAFAVGEALAKAALAKKCESVVFDRNGFLYHGRVKQLAEGARAWGLKF